MDWLSSAGSAARLHEVGKGIMSDFRFSPRPNRAQLIAWRSWGAPAFVEAREQDKPILLSISAAWCHWCHVMDETTYSDDAIIDTINRGYIPVRVDSDRRPDINHRYNRGGWPTTVPAIAGGIGDLLANCDGGTDSRTGPVAFAISGARLPGPGGGFGLAWPG